MIERATDETKRGNLGRVRDALQGTPAVGEIVDYTGAHPLNAEMAAVKPGWYLVETVPGQEGVAAAHLVARRFGIFVPDIKYLPTRAWDAIEQKTIIVRGEKLDRKRRMFAGYIFVFAWLDEQGKNWGRIHAIPGVRRVVCWPDGKIAGISDNDINMLRSLETVLCPIEIPAEFRGAKRGKRHGWRRFRRKQDEQETMLTSVKGWLHIGDGHWIDTITALRVLDGRDENQALAKALGLAS